LSAQLRGENGFGFVLFMRRVGRIPQLLPGNGAGVDHALVSKLPPHGLVDGTALRLVHRPFVPRDSQPGEVFDGLHRVLGFATKRIEILDS
jgi:hypothetical protein